MDVEDLRSFTKQVKVIDRLLGSKEKKISIPSEKIYQEKTLEEALF